MKLLRIIVTSSILFASLNEVSAQSVTSENLVNIHNLNTTQISGLVAPSKGSLVYNTDSNKLFVFDGTVWMATATVDTTSLSNRINQRVRYSDTAAMLIGYVRKADTAAMLNPYLRKADTSSLSTRINARVRYVDTASMLTNYATKANLKDTATVLRGLITSSMVDTSSLSTRINARVKYTDTAAMLSPYARTSKVLLDSTVLASNINARVRYTDTAAMLINYATKANLKDTATVLRGLINSAIIDTSSLSNRIEQRVKYTDTATILAGYIRKSKFQTDSTMFLGMLNTKMNYSDTASMLTNYVNNATNGLTKTGKTVQLGGTLTAATTITNSGANTLRIGGLTSGDLNDSIVVSDPSNGQLMRISANRITKADSTTASNGLTITGKDVRMGGTLTAATTITNSGANTLRISGLTSGSMNDSLVVSNPTTGELQRISANRIAKVDSTTATNGLTLTGKDVRLGGNLSSATTITSSGNALTFVTGGSAVNITGLSSGALTDSLLTVNASTGRVNRINSAQLNKADSTTASNGLTITGKDVRLGGALTAATTITTTAGNTLSLAGLQSGTSSDSVVVADATTGLLKRISSNRLTSGWLLTGNSGTTAGTNFIGTTDNIDLVFKVNNVESGRLNLYNLSASYGYNSVAAYKSTAMGYGASTGTGTESVAIGQASSSSYRSIALGSEAATSSSNSVALGQASTAAYQATALGSTASATGNNSTAIGFGATTSQANALILGNSSAQVGIGTSTPGYALDVNATTNPLKLSGLVSGALTDSILTVNTSGVVRRVASSLVNKADSTTASNGLTMTSKDVRLGGALTAATTITTTATNTLSLAGLQSGSVNDSVLMITSGNVIRRINSNAVAKEPFNVVGGTTQATSNTQDIYTQGNVSVGKTSSAATLDVGGKVKADSNISAPSFSSTYQNFGSAGGAINWNLQSGSTAGIRLTSNGTLSITNVTAGMYGLIRVTQDGTGGRTLTLPAGSRVINGGSGAVSLTQTANSVDVLTFFYDGTNYWWTIGNNYN